MGDACLSYSPTSPVASPPKGAAMPREQQQVTNEEAIKYLRANREFMEAYESRKGRKDFKPLEQYSRPELLRRYRGVIRAEATGKPVSITELRRGKAKTPEHPGRIRHIQQRKGVAEQWQVGSKRKQPTGEHLQKLRKKTSGNSQGEVVIVIHGLMLYEMPGGDECVERTWSKKVSISTLDNIVEDSKWEGPLLVGQSEDIRIDIYQVAHLLSAQQIRWCEIWEISILPGFERKAA
jgi:hypothetical protein